MVQTSNDETQALIKKIIFEIFFIALLILTPIYVNFILNKVLTLNDLLFLLIVLFALSFLASVLAPQFSFLEILLFSALLPGTFFVIYFKKLTPSAISLSFFIFWLFIALALFLSKKEEEKIVEISFVRIFKTFWNWFFLGAFFFGFIIFFFQHPTIREGKFFLSSETTQYLIKLSSPFIKEIDKDFEPHKTLKNYLQNKKINVLGIDVNLPLKEMIEEFNKKTGLAVKEDDSLSSVLASYIAAQYENLNFSQKRVIFISLVLILLFIYESLIVFIGSLLALIANIFFWLFSLTGLINIKAQPRGKEKISF